MSGLVGALDWQGTLTALRELRGRMVGVAAAGPEDGAALALKAYGRLTPDRNERATFRLAIATPTRRRLTVTTAVLEVSPRAFVEAEVDGDGLLMITLDGLRVAVQPMEDH